jgi:hypothetical protein
MIPETHVIVITSYDPFYLATVEQIGRNSLSEKQTVTLIDTTQISAAIATTHNKFVLSLFGEKFPSIDLKQHYSNIGMEYISIEKNKYGNATIDGSIENAIQNSVNSALISLYRHHNPIREVKNAKRFSQKLQIESAAIYNFLFDFLRNNPSVSRIFIPNGRFPGQKAAALAGQAYDKDIRFYERGFFPSTYYLETFEPQSRIFPQLSAEAITKNLDVKVIETGALSWINERSSPQSRTNEYASLWKQSSYIGVNQNDQRKLAGFFTSSQDEFLSLGKEWQIQQWDDQFQALDVALNKVLEKGFRAFVRIHPNLANKSRKYFKYEKRRFEALQNKFPNVQFYWHDDPVNSYTLLGEIDLCVVWDSTIGLEASALGIPTLTLAASRYGQISDVKEIFCESDFQDIHFNWEVSTIGAQKFITYLATRDKPLSVDPGKFITWNYVEEPLGVQISRIFCTGGAPNIWRALLATLDPYRNRSFSTNLRYVIFRLLSIAPKINAKG